MRDFKRFTSKKIKTELIGDGENDLMEKLIVNSGTGNFKLWADRFDCQIITSKKALDTKINYIHNNPVKAGLAKEITDWKYSSARNYYTIDNSLIDVLMD